MTPLTDIFSRAGAFMGRGAVLAAALTVAACGADTSFWTPAASPKANKVELTHLAHDVGFTGGGVEIDGPGLRGLAAFLDRNDIGYGDRIYVVVPGENPGAVATRRAEGVARLLARQGLSANVLANAEWAGVPATSDAVRVLVHRFVAVVPRCPDWSKPPVDYGNTQASNWGCANAVNFGMMLADPRELIEGKPEGDASGETSAAAVKRYYTDKVRPLDKSGTEDKSGGAGGGGQ